LCFPLTLYILERLFRIAVAKQQSPVVTMATMHGDDVIQLQMKLKNFKVKPGQSIGIKCPSISNIEVHPFSVTSSSSFNVTSQKDDVTCEVFIKGCGDWTYQLKEKLAECENDYKQKFSKFSKVEKNNFYCDSRSDAFHTKSSRNNKSFVTSQDSDDLLLEIPPTRNFPRITVEGPFSSPLQSLLRHKTSVCVCGGIGVTPFASFINYLLTVEPKRLRTMKIKRLDLIWVSRNTENFLWFADIIKKFRKKTMQCEVPDFFSVSLHFTGHDIEGETPDLKLLEGIPLFRGRPDISEKFREYTKTKNKSKVAVFCCGPRGLLMSVRRACKQSTSRNHKFTLHEESFS